MQSGRNALLTTFSSHLRFASQSHPQILRRRNVGLFSGYLYGEAIDPSKVRDAILQGVQNYWDERAAIAITHTNYYKEW